MPAPSTDPKVNTLLQTIASERRNLEGAKAVMRAVEASSRNEAVIQQAQNEVRSAQASIKFLEDELAKLQVSASGTGSAGAGPSAGNGAGQAGGGYGGGGHGHGHGHGQSGQPGPSPRGGPPGSRGQGGYGYQSQQSVPMTPTKGSSAPASGAVSPSPSRQMDRDRPLPPPPAGDEPRRPEQKNYTQLDLLRYDAPLTGAKITRMLNQLQFKLQVEEQYKLGIEKMAQAYRAEGDKRLRTETDSKRIESDGKIQLLRKAKRRYETLAKFGGAVEDDEDLVPDNKRKDALRKPISGKLVISLRSARDLNHRPLPRKSSKVYNETTVVIKIEGNQAAISHPTRNDRWLEDFHIPVEKANEVEITIYDTVAPGDTAPIGMLWLRVSDLMEALRRQKAVIEAQEAGWVTADKATMMGPRTGSAPDSVSLHSSGTIRQPGGGPFGGGPGGKGSEGIEGWFSVEPAGAISLRLDFVKDTVAGARRPYEALNRQGAVRKRKGDVYEMNGHQFVQKQFYQPVMCALCQEFLLTGEGYQCEDCRYACHKKCYPKVVTKCISKSNADGEDEEKINHRIPHRFTGYTNMSANWCCHCGFLLPFGRKNSVKCSECSLTCHQTCSHLVPDFCGMTMEMANVLLKNLRDIKTTQSHKKPAVTLSQTSTSTSSVSTLPQYRPPTPERPERPAPPQQRPSQQFLPPIQQSQQPPFQGFPGQPQPQQQQQQPPQQQYQQPVSQQNQQGRPTSTYGAQQQPPQMQPGYDPSRPAPSGGRPMPPAPMQQRTSYENQQQSRPQEYQQQGQQAARPVSQHQQIPPAQHQQQQQQQYAQMPSVAPQSRPEPPRAQSGYVPPPPPPGAQPVPQPQHLQQQQQTQQQQQQQGGYAPAPSKTMPPPIGSAGAVVPSASGAGGGAAAAAAIRRKRKVGLDDFNFLAVLGKGNFGKVMLAEEKASSSLYAIKVLKKEFIIENDEIESTQSEKRVFQSATQERHPFLLGLHSCFQTETRVYFVMEYVSGGDLMLHIQKKQFTLRQAKFYACEVLLALQYFHSQGIIYRDLKLDNILLGLDGHVRVADYGLCKEGMWYGNTTSTFCGTPEFMAPEILLEQRYGRAVDWWAFGVLTYEMLLGQSPFKGDDEDEIFDAILEDEPLYPITMPRDAVSLLQRLLTRDPVRRLGAGEADAEDIKKHLFFKDVNFEDVYNKRIPPPYFPTIGNATDTSNFDQEFTREQPTLTPVHTQLSAQDQQEFVGFSWVAPWAG